MSWWERQFKKQTEWKTWTPTFPGTTMTYSGVTVSYARYCEIGTMCHYYFRSVATLGGTARPFIEFTLPFGCKDTGVAEAIHIGNGYTNDDADTSGIVLGSPYGSSTALFYRANIANFTLGAGVVILASGTYETV